MFDKKIVLALWLSITVSDREDNGTYNYLLEDSRGKYAISYSSKTPLPHKEKELFQAKVDADCELDYAVDEALTEKLDQWITYRAYICNANSIEVLNEDLP